ncbi:hypothetical protein [Kiloniella sp. b19]|uniref:hypothetical protein n=1 Tax=Kiloniella sp. GXU_MW_B19 TaxID=3141326 RepID=UPI0031D48DD9
MTDSNRTVVKKVGSFVGSVFWLLLYFVFLSFVAYGIYLSWDLVLEYFLSSPEINGPIAFLFFAACAVTFWGLLSESYWTAKIQSTLDSAGKGQGAERRSFLERAIFGGSGDLGHFCSRFRSGEKFSLEDFEVSLGYAYGSAETVLRFLPAAMVTLGLIGTFLGLSATVSALSSLLGGLNIDGGATDIISEMMAGLPRAISGMGVAFHTSLYGVTTSLLSGVLVLLYQKNSSSSVAKVRHLSEELNMILEDSSAVAAHNLLTVSDELQKTMTDFRGAVLTSIGDLVAARKEQLELLRQTAFEAKESQRRTEEYFRENTQLTLQSTRELTGACSEISVAIANSVEANTQALLKHEDGINEALNKNSQLVVFMVEKLGGALSSIETTAEEALRTVKSVSDEMLGSFRETTRQEFSDIHSKIDELVPKINEVMEGYAKNHSEMGEAQKQVLVSLNELRSNVTRIEQTIPADRSDDLFKELYGVGVLLQDILNSGFNHFPKLEANLQQINASLLEVQKQSHENLLGNSTLKAAVTRLEEQETLRERVANDERESVKEAAEPQPMRGGKKGLYSMISRIFEKQ